KKISNERINCETGIKPGVNLLPVWFGASHPNRDIGHGRQQSFERGRLMKANGGALRRIWDGTLLAGVNGAAVACLFPGMASAAQYDVASLGELN
ncbi:hypothetical protein, partial [Mesorhizobium sp. M2E.F.Ca.ET.209.01.1.1]|uniref:hypothetical protein n=1 Tax=Mesorhizobium sp. M2E.F.Ca.ET.209.01.1.1 TaxID=2500526 RepID=UPI0016777650